MSIIILQTCRAWWDKGQQSNESQRLHGEKSTKVSCAISNVIYRKLVHRVCPFVKNDAVISDHWKKFQDAIHNFFNECTIQKFEKNYIHREVSHKWFVMPKKISFSQNLTSSMICIKFIKLVFFVKKYRCKFHLMFDM